MPLLSIGEAGSDCMKACPLQTNCFGRLEVDMSGELVGETDDHFWTLIDTIPSRVAA